MIEDLKKTSLGIRESGELDEVFLNRDLNAVTF